MSAERTRFAPSPTGYLHVGGMRTAVFAYLAARHSGGQFILRLEDTDLKREVAGSDQHIIDCLKALGLDYDEGPDRGGPYGPYRQSERLKFYQDYGRQLVKAGRAYADPYTPEQVQSFRDEAQANHQAYLYRRQRPKIDKSWEVGQPLRFKSEPKAYQWHDAVMGDLSAPEDVIDDFILIKSDGYPTYNFAHIVDDHLMKISLVIRGQEYLASVPNYLNLYEALEFKPPTLATVPPVLSPGGRKKLSKRDHAKDILDYIREGYLPEALINFMASLGWNDGTEQEIFSVAELISKFDIGRVQRGGALFDERRLLWMDGVHIRNLPLEQLSKLAASYWPEEAKAASAEHKQLILGAVQERLKYLAELPELTSFFFVDLPINPDLIKQHKQLSKLSRAELVNLLEQTKQSLSGSDFSQSDLTKRLNDLITETKQKPVVLFSLIRIAITQTPASPALGDTLAILGKARSLSRIEAQLKALS